MLKKGSDDVTFASVLADGKIHISVPEGTEGAIVRKYETSDGKEGSKIEMVYKELIGKITKINFYEGDFGRQLQVTITDKGESIVLSLGTSSNYGEDMMKKLMNVDLDKKVKIVPYSFLDDKKKSKKGITIWQMEDGEAVKIANYFYDADKKKNIHGYPEPKEPKKGKVISKDQWKLYFGEVREFLVETLTEHFKIEESAGQSNSNSNIDDLAEDDEDIEDKGTGYDTIEDDEDDEEEEAPKAGKKGKKGKAF